MFDLLIVFKNLFYFLIFFNDFINLFKLKLDILEIKINKMEIN